jgi:hypothetical protein
VKQIVFFVFVFSFLAGCGGEKGNLRIWLIDAPPPQNVEHIYLTILRVQVRNAEGEVITLQEDIHRIDALQLTGGYAAPLTFNYSNATSFVDVDPGDYTGVSLFVAQINSLVMEGDSIADSLLIPEEYYPFQFELDQDFTVLPGEYQTLVIDFDAGKSINWWTQPYELTPAFRIFESSTAGFLRGAVRDTSGAFVKLAAVQAVSLADTMTVLSADLDTTYSYCLMLPEGTYDISASANGYSISDTVYEGVVVSRNSVLDGYNFTLE